MKSLRRGRESGQLSSQQAKELKRELGQIRVMESRYAKDGLTPQEGAEIRNRVEVLRAITNGKRTGMIK